MQVGQRAQPLQAVEVAVIDHAGLILAVALGGGVLVHGPARVIDLRLEGVGLSAEASYKLVFGHVRV